MPQFRRRPRMVLCSGRVPCSWYSLIPGKAAVVCTTASGTRRQHQPSATQSPPFSLAVVGTRSAAHSDGRVPL